MTRRNGPKKRAENWLSGVGAKSFDIGFKLASPLLLRAFKRVAETGEGSDLCLKYGFLPIPIHYYQPVPDIEDLEAREVWGKVSDLSGIRISAEASFQFLSSMAENYAHECNWLAKRHPENFYLENTRFSYGCAAALHCVLRSFKPKQLIEVGSGFSSRVISAALDANRSSGHGCDFTIIDPYPDLPPRLSTSAKVIKQPIQTCELDMFRKLTENDVLFIDSSHVAKTGSDVNFEILDVLPILRKGVLVHFHDIPMPFEYPRSYFTNPSFRVFWNESYLLQAFLACNRDYEVLLPMCLLQTRFLPQLETLFPASRGLKQGWVSGSFWIRRTDEFRGVDRKTITWGV